MIYVFVTSRIDYNSLYLKLNVKMTLRLQLVENAAASLLNGSGHCEHIRPISSQSTSGARSRSWSLFPRKLMDQA